MSLSERESAYSYAGFLFGLVMASIVWILAILLFQKSEREDFENEAVKHEAAEYILDPATGKTTWQWKTEVKP